MKKLLAFLLFGFFAFSVFAQIPVVRLNNPDIYGIEETKMIKETDFPYASSKSNSREDIQSEWYSFTSALNYYLGGTMKFYTNYIFPDSLPQRLYTDAAPSHLKWHSVGIAFDPYDEMWTFFQQDRLARRQPYTIDSIAFRYLYHKYNDNDLKDELVLQFYHTNKINYYTFTQSQERFATVQFNPTTLSGVDFHKEIKYELDYDDTATFESGVYKWQVFPVNLSVPKPMATGANVAAVTMLFKPKYSYSMGDTFYAPADKMPYKKLNSFWYQQFYDESHQNLNYYNNGLMMNYEIRYDKVFGEDYGWRYLPGSAWTNSLYPYIMFKITYDRDYVESVQDAENNFKITRVYPNPSAGNASLELILDNAADVSIDVINAMGQVVDQVVNTNYASGDQKINFSTSDLLPGVYFLRVTVNGIPSTQSLIIE